MPKGSYIERYGTFDNGEENLSFKLTGLRLVVFPEPLPILDILISTLDIDQGLWVNMSLSQDTEIAGRLCKKNQDS